MKKRLEQRPSRVMAGGSGDRASRSRGSTLRTGLYLVATLTAALALSLVLTACSAEEPSTTPASTGGTESTTSSTVTTSPSSTTPTPPTSTSTGGQVPGGVVTEAERLSPNSGHFVICQDCHAFLDPPLRPRPALNPPFGHEKHLAYATCESCHLTPVHTQTGVRKPPMSQCYTCHGPEPEAVASADCDLCHPPDFPKMPSSHDAAFFAAGHPRVVEAQGTTECFLCHPGGQKGFCRACHGLDMPHPQGWALAPEGGPGPHVQTAYDQGSVCVRCHSNTVAPPGNCYGGECHGP